MCGWYRQAGSMKPSDCCGLIARVFHELPRVRR